jgi:hypothetical protein
MRRSSKIFLGIGLLLLAVSYTHFETLAHGIFKPLGAVFVILAFIANFLPDREYEVFNEDHHVRDKLLEAHSVEEAKDPNVPSGTRFEHAR